MLHLGDIWVPVSEDDEMSLHRTMEQILTYRLSLTSNKTTDEYEISAFVRRVCTGGVPQGMHTGL
jgi:hypothetical protein